MMTSIQKLSTYGIKLDKETPRNSRAYLDTGKLCNYKCEFCYYKDQLNERDSLEEIKKRIDYIDSYGLNQIDLSGGESSIEPNWFNILDYCKEKGFKNISTLSNGSKFSDYEFLKKSKEHGLNEILFSLHGYNNEIHDYITGVPGSFESILQAIKNCHDLNIVVRINCTVYDINYNHIHDIYPDLIKTLSPLEVNFIALKYNSDNTNFRKISYFEITEQIKKAIDKIKDYVEFINVRFVPFCFMSGYEKYVCNYYQLIYDLYDWNRATYNQIHTISKKYTDSEKLQHDMDAAKWFRVNGFHKDKECKQCKYFYICDGIDNKLKATELIPVIGDKINDINYFRKDFYASVYSHFNS